MKYRLGIDLGGTNIVAAVVDEKYKIVGKASCKTAVPRPEEEICDSMAEVALKMGVRQPKTLDDMVQLTGMDKKHLEELLEENENLSLELDPKCAWALRNMHLFPVEINSADVETLLRVPGIGAKGAYKIVAARRFATLTFSDLQKMRIVLKRARHFITCAGKFYGIEGEERVRSALSIAERIDGASQMSFFDGENSGLLLPKEKQPSLSLLTPTEDAEKRFLLTSSAENARAVLSGQF